MSRAWKTFFPYWQRSGITVLSRHYEKKGEKKESMSEFELPEYHLKDAFKTTEDALKLFQVRDVFYTPQPTSSHPSFP
jgi:hypothetical protein